MDFKWSDENTGQPGWYATVSCWDIQEGMFPGAHYWDGMQWGSDGPIVAYCGPFGSQADALLWARAHDPEFPPPKDTP